MSLKITLLILPIVSILVFSLVAEFIEHLHFPAVFNFGDSNCNTGGLVAGLAEPLEPPNGQNYFGKSSGRFCDGRLIIDFLMDAMDLPSLNAYLESIGSPTFCKGCNFAAAGSTILPATASSVSSFSFGVQVAHFFGSKKGLKICYLKQDIFSIFSTDQNTDKLRLDAVETTRMCTTSRIRFNSILAQEGLSQREQKVVIAEISKKLIKYLPQESYFREGLYMFDIGQNDLAGAFYSKSEDQLIASIPNILLEFDTGVQKLYDKGERRLWIHNTGPLGCFAMFGKDPSKLDELGCVSSHSLAAKLFNLQLHALCRKLQGQFSDANITYIDIFTIKLNIISNYSRYGFEQPIIACCGYGGPPLNYDSRVACGRTKNINGSLVTAKGCDDSSEHISWDGIHYSEAANQYVSSQILTGKYSDPPFADKMPYILTLKF